MRDAIKDSARRISDKVWANAKPIIYVAPDGTQTTIHALRWTETQNWAEGVEIDSTGIQDEEVMQVSLNAAELTELGVEIDAAGHFLIDGLRWDFDDERPIRRETAPVTDDNRIGVWLRRAEALRRTESVSTWGFEPS